MTSMFLKNINPTRINILKCIRFHRLLNNHGCVCLSTTSEDSDEKTNRVNISSPRKETSFIDNQYFSEILEENTGVDNTKAQTSREDVESQFPRNIKGVSLKETHHTNVNSISDVEDMTEIDIQYFSSISKPTETATTETFPTTSPTMIDTVQQHLDNSYWIYDSIQEINNETELSKLKKSDMMPKILQTHENVSEENNDTGQFVPHEFATPLQESQEYSEMLKADKLADLREQLEHVRTVNKMLHKRDVVRGEKKKSILLLPNLPANVQENELEPSVADAVRVITKKKTKRKKKNINYLKLYGTTDPDSAGTSIPCCGCGAFLHCQDVTAGGYLASEKFKKLSESELVKTPCQRCTLIMSYNHAINVNVTENDFQEMFNEIKKKNALILVMVDLLDFPISFIPNMKSKVGKNKKIILIGNKVDLLPADSHDCHKRIKKQLMDASIANNVCVQDQILSVHLISSKLGYGVEDLISNIQSKWATKGDVYLIGTANSGKSTLFNRFLNSDFCKTKAKWIYKKATVSRWPGTTLNLLKFPILKPNIELINRREARLQDQKEVKEWRERINKHDKEFDAAGYFRGHVGRSFDGDLYDDHRQTFNLVSGNKTSSNLPFKFDPSEFIKGKWLFDTPGIIREEQVLSKLTAEELKLCVSSQAFRPKTMVIKPGQTIFLAGLGRLDYLHGIQTIFCTMYAAPTLPIRVVNTENADQFYKENAGYRFLKVPCGGEERLKTLPPLIASDDVTIEGIHQKESAADILFASAGWLAITPNRGLKAVLRPYTIGGLGCVVRTPALLPFLVNLRGSRIARSQPFYRVDVDKLVKYHG